MGRQHCRLSIWMSKQIQYKSLPNIRRQDPNIYSDTETKALSRYGLRLWSSPLAPSPFSRSPSRTLRRGHQGSQWRRCSISSWRGKLRPPSSLPPSRTLEKRKRVKCCSGSGGGRIPVRREEARDLEERAPGSQSDTVVETEKIPATMWYSHIMQESQEALSSDQGVLSSDISSWRQVWHQREDENVSHKLSWGLTKFWAVMEWSKF